MSHNLIFKFYTLTFQRQKTFTTHYAHFLFIFNKFISRYDYCLNCNVHFLSMMYRTWVKVKKKSIEYDTTAYCSVDRLIKNWTVVRYCVGYIEVKINWEFLIIFFIDRIVCMFSFSIHIYVVVNAIMNFTIDFGFLLWEKY